MRQHTMFKRLLSGALALSLALTLAPAAAAAELSDVPAGAWYAKAVNYCHERELLLAGEDGLFAPEEPLTRSMVAHALYLLADRPEVDLAPEEFESGEEAKQGDGKEEETQPPEPVSPFLDVPLDAPDADAIFWSWQQGFVDGYDDGRFGPDDLVTREQLSVILWRSMGSKLPQVSARFEDRPSIARWAINGVEWAHEQGLISGKPGNRFDPQGTATRAEGAAILMRYDQAFLHPSETETPEPGPLLPNAYDSEGFSIQNGFLTYQGDAPCYIGVDVSSHQKEIDWARVAASGVQFAMIRVGYRGYSVGSINKDAYFDQNIRGALDNGLEVGVYFFSQATSVEEAEEEALQTLAWIEGYDITYPVVFDWEQVDQDSSRTKDAEGKTTTECAQTFCSMVEEAGYTAMTYGSPSKIYAGGLQLEELTQYPFWLAHYTRDWAPSSFRYHYHMWQYSSSGEVDGIEGRVDLDLCLTDWSTWNQP